MANIFIKGEKLAATAMTLLRKRLQAASLFSIKLGLSDFKGAEGDTVGIRRPAVLVARDKGWRNEDEIVVDKLVNTKIQVRLNRHPYSAVELTAEERTLDEVNYVRDVQTPQVDAVGEFFENSVIGALRGAKFIREAKFNPESSSDIESDPRKVARRGRKLLNQLQVPSAGRYWVVGSDVSEAIGNFDKLLDVDTSGLPEALREGVVGKLSGFVIVELDSLEPDESYFFHETAVAVAAVAPEVPQGAAKGGGVAAGQGLAVTQIWDYDSKTLKDRSVVHAFTGATPVLDPEVNAEGAIVLDEEGLPQMEFKRAVKVVFGATASGRYTVEITADSGDIVFTIDGDDTEPIPFDAPNTAIKAALNALEGVSGVKVTGTGTTKNVDLGRAAEFTGTGVTITAA